MVGKKLEEKWKKRLKELKTYKKKHGDCLVSTLDKQNAKLGTWVAHQRKEYNKWRKGVHATITKKRIDKLNEINFDWKGERGSQKDDTLWKQHFNELVKYKKKHGDCLVPYKYEPNATLGRWVGTQRQEYKKWLNGVHSKITQERIDQLNEIDFKWEVGKHQYQPDDRLWKQRFNDLVKYKKKHGDCLVPQNYEHINEKLGMWVSRQRAEYKKWLRGVHTSITQERIDQLNEIDFVWEVAKGGSQKDDALWKQRLKELKAYKKKYGDCLVPQNYEQNAQLGIWVSNQRAEYKKWLNGVHSRITQERIDQLNEIDFVWDARFERDANKSKQESSIPSVARHHVASTKTKSNQQRKRQIPSKDRPKKRQRRQSKNIVRELSSRERRERRRFVLQALYNCRNPMQPDEVVSL